MTAPRLGLGCLATIACCLAAGSAAEAQGPGRAGGAVEVETVPRLPGVKLSFEGRRYRTDRDGRALVRGAASREELERKLRVRTTKVRRGVRARFGGWHKGRLALALDYFVRPRFVDVHGKAIDPERIDSITLKSSFGVPVRFKGAGIGWLEGRGLLPAGNDLKPKLVFQSVQRVMVDDSNVVNRGQQRFAPARHPRVRLELLFFSARFRSRDALFGFPVGSRIRLEYPDGRERELELEDGAELTLNSLARGPYEVDVEGPGVSFSRPLSLSRDQDLQLQVITWLDFVVVLLLLVVIVVGLMLIGRPRLVRRIPVLGPRLSRRSVGSRP